MRHPLHVNVVRGLQELKGHWREVAEAGGISKRTLEKVAYGVSKNPLIETLAKIDFGIEAVRRRQKRLKAS